MFEYMFLPFRRYAEFTGRSRRLEFWAFGLFNLVVYAVIGGIVLGTGATVASLENAQGNPVSVVTTMFFSGFGLLFGLYWLATIVPTIAVTIRRLHDRDMSGWWYLGFIVLSLIPLVGFVAGIVFLVITLLPGTPGDNRFGPDPKDPSRQEVFA